MIKTGALTTLGSSIYALPAGDTQKFYRYNIGANTWAARTNIPAKVKEGGALTNDGTYVYALSAKDSTNFYRYDPGANSWLAMANIPAKVYKGGALTYDGTYIYALPADDSQGFYRYDISADTWSARTDIPAKVKEGGALVYAQGGASTDVAFEVDRSLVKNGDTIKVTMHIEAATAVNNVSPTALTVTDLNSQGAGVTPANCGSPTLTSANDDISGPGDEVTYTWTCQAVYGTGTGNIRFSGSATGTGGTFAVATSNSVLVTPPLTFQVTVNDPATVSQVKNTAQISDDSGTIPPTDSNETLTTMPGGSIGDYVWWDDNLNGTPDSGELPIPDNTIVLLYRDVNNNGILDPLGGDVQVGGPAFTSGGSYLFGDLPPGNYLVDVYEDSIAAQFIPYLRNIVPTTADVQYKSLAQGENYLNADFGYFIGAKVEGNVFWDEDHNGVLDPDEQDSPHLLNNVAVTIVCYGPDGVPGGSDDRTYTQNTGQTTPPPAQPNGHFAFIVPAGPCTLTYDTTQTNLLGYPEATTPVSYSFTAEAGEDWHPTFDFGVDNAGKIGDRVWNDANGNGIQNVGEPGLANVTVYLCSSTPCNSGNADRDHSHRR